MNSSRAALIEAIIRIYSSVLSPDALFYRQIHGLDDYDERMAIMTFLPVSYRLTGKMRLRLYLQRSFRLKPAV